MNMEVPKPRSESVPERVTHNIDGLAVEVALTASPDYREVSYSNAGVHARAIVEVATATIVEGPLVDIHQTDVDPDAIGIERRRMLSLVSKIPLTVTEPQEPVAGAADWEAKMAAYEAEAAIVAQERNEDIINADDEDQDVLLPDNDPRRLDRAA